VRPLKLELRLLSLLSNPLLGTNSLVTLFSAAAAPVPRPLYLLRWRVLGPRTKLSRDALEGNAAAPRTSGEGKGVRALEGTRSVEPLGVRMGEEA